MNKFDPFKKYEFEFDSNGWFSSCLVPKHIKVCPCCKSQLIIDCEVWFEENNIHWPDEVSVDCLRDRQGNRPLCFIENENHEANRMPYVYWLPIETHCKAWLDEMLLIYYNLSPFPKRWLEMNGQGNLLSILDP